MTTVAGQFQEEFQEDSHSWQGQLFFWLCFWLVPRRLAFRTTTVVLLVMFLVVFAVQPRPWSDNTLWRRRRRSCSYRGTCKGQQDKPDLRCTDNVDDPRCTTSQSTIRQSRLEPFPKLQFWTSQRQVLSVFGDCDERIWRLCELTFSCLLTCIRPTSGTNALLSQDGSHNHHNQQTAESLGFDLDGLQLAVCEIVGCFSCSGGFG